MITCIRRFFSRLPLADLSGIQEETLRLSERARELVALQGALKDIREVAEEKKRVLRSIPPIPMESTCEKVSQEPPKSK